MPSSRATIENGSCARQQGDLAQRMARAAGAARCTAEEDAHARPHAGSLRAKVGADDPAFVRRCAGIRTLRAHAGSRSAA
eukprot:8533439-Pyramimonas_sp.AAC.1